MKEYKMPKSRKVFKTVLAVALLPNIFTAMNTSAEEVTIQKPTLNIHEIFQRESDTINESLPMSVDKATSLFHTVYSNGTFIYKNRLIGYNSDELPSETFREITTKMLLKSFCNRPLSHDFAKHDISINYKYYGQDNKFIAEVLITPADCYYARKKSKTEKVTNK